MDRHAKVTRLRRLRYLLVELIELLKEPEYDVLNWSDIVKAIREIDQLSSDLAIGRVMTIEGDQVVHGRVGKTGRVQSWRPTGRTAVKVGIVHPRGGMLLSAALWYAMRQADVVDNLRRWVRFVHHQEIVVFAGGEPSGNADLLELTAEDIKILNALSKAGVAVFQEDLAVSAKLDRKTISPRLKHLRTVGFVKHPDGKKRGNLITVAGRERLAQVPTTSS